MAYFSNITDVRAESGFNGNTNITDAELTKYLKRGDGEVKSTVSAVYDIANFTGANFTGSQAEDFLKGATDLLASGYLLIKEYGAEGLDSDKDGYNKVNEGRSMLKMLFGDRPLRLIGLDNTEFARIESSTAGTVSAGGATSGENTFAVDDVY